MDLYSDVNYFFYDSVLRRTIEMLNMFKCFEFTYTLAGGILLSEFVYEQRIPWDNDIDIFLTFKSFNRADVLTFIQHVKSYIQIKYEFSVHFYSAIDDESDIVTTLGKPANNIHFIITYIDELTSNKIFVKFLILQYDKTTNTAYERIYSLNNKLTPNVVKTTLRMFDVAVQCSFYEDIYSYIDQRYEYCRFNLNEKRFWINDGKFALQDDHSYTALVSDSFAGGNFFYIVFKDDHKCFIKITNGKKIIPTNYEIAMLIKKQLE